MKGKRRNHSAQFKVKVALAAIKGDQTVAELSSKYQVHATQATQWKKQLLEALPEVFGVAAGPPVRWGLPPYQQPLTQG